jgi:hypothetical protein
VEEDALSLMAYLPGSGTGAKGQLEMGHPLKKKKKGHEGSGGVKEGQGVKCPRGSPDYVIGSDLLYSAQGQEALAETLRTLTMCCGGEEGHSTTTTVTTTTAATIVLLCVPSRAGREELLLSRHAVFDTAAEEGRLQQSPATPVLQRAMVVHREGMFKVIALTALRKAPRAI